VRAVIAESYERIHRSNLVGMGIVPLQYLPGQTAETLGLNGHEEFTIELPEQIKPGQNIQVDISLLQAHQTHKFALDEQLAHKFVDHYR